MPDATPWAIVIAQTFGLAAAVTWLVRRVARRRGWLAPLRPDRWHREPTALHGGVGIFTAFALGLLWHLPWSPFMAALLGVTTVMFLTGLVDDTADIRPQTKVVLQVAGGLLLYAADFHFNDAFPWWLDLGIVVFWVVAVTNAMNLLDNMNGLAAGTAVIAGVSRLLLFQQTGNADGVLASAVFIGAVLGFLIFNFPKASIFMGDGGSFTIGFALAALNLTGGQAYSKTAFSIFVFPVLALALPIFDTAFVSVMRYFSGRAISQGGRDHTSHRLVAIGLSETTAVVILWSISAAAGAIAYLLYNVGFNYALFAAAILLLGLVLLGIVLSRVRVYEEGAAPDGPAAAFGFTLPGELVYKRQILWVLVDAVTVVLALNAALTMWLPATAASAAESVLPAVAVMMALLAFGVYRWDWALFGWPLAARMVAGTALGVLIGTLVHGWSSTAPRWSAGAALGAVLLVTGSVCATRVAVRILDRWLHTLGGARG